MSTPNQIQKEVADRIRLVIRDSGLSKNAFAIRIGHRNMTKTLAANKVPGTGILLDLHQHYPQVNLDWLLTGRGEMYFNSYDQDSGSFISQDNNSGYTKVVHLGQLVKSLNELTNVVKEKL